jgi:hypothetical protein
MVSANEQAVISEVASALVSADNNSNGLRRLLLHFAEQNQPWFTSIDALQNAAVPDFAGPSRRIG